METTPGGFPRELLAQPWNARINYFQTYTMGHPRLVTAREALLNAIHEVPPNSLILVLGPTGVGKTTLRAKIEQLLAAELISTLEVDPGRLAVVSVECIAPESGSFGWRDHFRRLLLQMEEPLVDYKINPAARVRTGEKVVRFMPSAKAVGAEYHQAVERALAFRNLSGQLSRRSLDIHFPRYRADDPVDLKAFGTILRSFERQLPLSEPPDLVNEWEYLYERSIGCVGVLKDWLVRALVSVSRRNATTLTRRDLQAHALSVAQCTKMLSETVEGESTLLESPEARSRLRTRLGLTTTETNREIADVAKAARPMEPSPPRQHPRKPGQRRPVRDPVGIPTAVYANAGTV